MSRTVPLRVQLLAIQIAIVLLVVATVGVVTVVLQERTLREQYTERMIDVAASVARNEIILEAFDSAEPATTIAPIAEVVRQGAGVTYVVVTDANGTRYSHPNPDRIGEQVSTDPSVPLSGGTFVGTETGTLGTSWRVKLPVRDADGEIIGSASVGILESELAAELGSRTGQIVLLLGGAAVLGTIAATWATRVIRRRIFGVEPEEIAPLLEAREATLHAIREGLIAVDDRERITLVNDEARRLLGLADDADLRGDAVRAALDPALADLLAAGPGADRLVLVGERVLFARVQESRTTRGVRQQTLLLRDRTDLHHLLRELDGAHGLTDGLRAQAHEFSNHLHVIAGLLELGYVTDARAYIAAAGKGGGLEPIGTEVIHDVEVLAILHSLRARAGEHDITLELTPDSGLPDLVERPRLRGDVCTVVGNLCENAFEAAGPGGTVRLRVAQEPGAVVVEVHDDGPGVPPDRARQVFTAGYSTKDTRRGTRGIGLALVHRIAVRRSGSARVIPGDGGAFVVVLPFRDPAPGPAGGTGPADAERAGSRS